MPQARVAAGCAATQPCAAARSIVRRAARLLGAHLAAPCARRAASEAAKRCVRPALLRRGKDTWGVRRVLSEPPWGHRSLDESRPAELERGVRTPGAAAPGARALPACRCGSPPASARLTSRRAAAATNLGVIQAREARISAAATQRRCARRAALRSLASELLRRAHARRDPRRACARAIKQPLLRRAPLRGPEAPQRRAPAVPLSSGALCSGHAARFCSRAAH